MTKNPRPNAAWMIPLLVAVGTGASAGGCHPPRGPSAGASGRAEGVAETEAKAPARWTTFMGNPARTGAAEGTPVTRPRLLWRRWIGIPGYLNNPVVTERLVIAGSSGRRWNRQDSSDGVYAFDLSTGRRRWRLRTHKDVNGITVGGDRVFVATDDRLLRALDLRTGALRWRHRASGPIYGAPIWLTDRVCYADGAGVVACLGTRSGRKLWNRRLRGSFRAPLASRNGRIIAVSSVGEVTALDRDTGKLLWRFRLRSAIRGLASFVAYAAPVIADEMVFVSFIRDTYYNTPPLLALDEGTGRLRWKATWPNRPRREVCGNLRATPAYAQGVLYFSLPYTNRMFALDAQSGEVSWSRSVGPCYFAHWSSAAVAGGLIYQARLDGRLYAMDEDGSILWTFQVSPRPRRVRHRQVPSKSCRWRPRGRNRTYASTAYHPSGVLVVTSGNGFLYAIGNR